MSIVVSRPELLAGEGHAGGGGVGLAAG